MNRALRMDGISDAWVNDLQVENTINSFYFGGNTSRLTIEHVDIHHAVARHWRGQAGRFLGLRHANAGGPLHGERRQRILFFHRRTHDGPGGGAQLRLSRQRPYPAAQVRWATGLLVDNRKGVLRRAAST